MHQKAQASPVRPRAAGSYPAAPVGRYSASDPTERVHVCLSEGVGCWTGTGLVKYFSTLRLTNPLLPACYLIANDSADVGERHAIIAPPFGCAMNSTKR